LINGKVCASIEVHGEVFEASFVCVPTDAHEKPGRRPATKRCRSADEAMQWIDREAAALGFPVEWVGAAERT
jgi:hypothetical protein